MSVITWDSNFSVNVKEIDEQHQHLIKMLNELHDAILKGEGHSILLDVLDKMRAYTVYHFGTEEKYFKDFAYDDSDLHIQQHNGFIAKTTEFINKYDAGDATLTLEVMDYLIDWVLHHILESDKKYSKCFNEHGLI